MNFNENKLKVGDRVIRTDISDSASAVKTITAVSTWAEVTGMDCTAAAYMLDGSGYWTHENFVQRVNQK